MNLKNNFKNVFYYINSIYFTPRTLSESENLNKDVKYLLVIGLPRTGTSLLQSLLNCYPENFISYESVYYPLLNIKNKKIRHAHYYELIKQYVHMERSLFEFDELKSSRGKDFSFVRKYSYFGDKMIYNQSPLFSWRLRKAVNSLDKVIFIVRDPRARYASYKRWINKRNKNFVHTSAVAENDLYTELRKWNKFSLVAERCRTKFDNCLITKYEDLVQDPVDELGRISNFLDLPITTTDDFSLSQMTHPNSVNKFLTELSSEEISKINQFTSYGRKIFSYND